MKKYSKKISVIMPNFNTELSILKEAVDSILNQTFQDFELIIVDDASTNGSYEYLQSFQDKRIRILRNPENYGVAKTLNIGLKAATGEYIARMDADDVSLPRRFEIQYMYMKNHPDVAMCGTNTQNIGADNKTRRTKYTDMDNYRIKTLFYYPGPRHPTIFLRKEYLERENILYNEELNYAEDYGLYADIGENGKIVILSDVLLLYRIHETQVSRRHNAELRQSGMKIQKKLLLEILDHVTDEETALHYRYSYDKKFSGIKDFFKCMIWYKRLIQANNRVKKYPQRKFAVFACKLFALITSQSVFLKE